MTLIETIVAIALMTIAVVGIVAGFANSEKITATAQGIAQSETALRTVVDQLRSNTAYQPCDSGSGPLYAAAVSGQVPAGYTLTLSVMRPDPSMTKWTFNSAVQTVQTPRADCGLTSALPQTKTAQNYPPSCPALHTCDFGLQRLTVTLTQPGRQALRQVIFKGAVS
jgi:Tfp pilus assembly protein PilV